MGDYSAQREPFSLTTASNCGIIIPQNLTAKTMPPASGDLYGRTNSVVLSTKRSIDSGIDSGQQMARPSNRHP
jgi:hypothetical protein